MRGRGKKRGSREERGEIVKEGKERRMMALLNR